MSDKKVMDRYFLYITKNGSGLEGGFRGNIGETEPWDSVRECHMKLAWDLDQHEHIEIVIPEELRKSHNFLKYIPDYWDILLEVAKVVYAAGLKSKSSRA